MDPVVVKFRTSNRRRMILVGMCILTAALLAVALYLTLKPGPCDRLVDEMCLRVGAPAEICSQFSESLLHLGADDKWCSDILRVQKTIPPELYFSVPTAAIRDLVKENIDKKKKAGEEVPKELQAFYDQLVSHTHQKGTEVGE